MYDFIPNTDSSVFLPAIASLWTDSACLFPNFKTRQLQSQAHIRRWVWSDTFFSLFLNRSIENIIDFCDEWWLLHIESRQIDVQQCFSVCARWFYCLPNEFKYRTWHTLVDDSVLFRRNKTSHMRSRYRLKSHLGQYYLWPQICWVKIMPTLMCCDN